VGAEAGDPESLERHWQGCAGEVAGATPFDGVSAGRAEESLRAFMFDDGQQHTVHERLRQHASVGVCAAAFDVDAEASPASDNTPTIAARATRENRR
jgi:hypothetical protein